MPWVNLRRLWLRVCIFSCLLGNNTIAHPLPTASEFSTSLEDLPTGQYYYAVSSRERSQDQSQEYGFVLLRKAGHSVIGIDRRSPHQAPCFRGFLAGNRIINATRIFPPYQPDSQWDHQENFLDLNRYYRVEHLVTNEETDALQVCLAFFSR